MSSELPTFFLCADRANAPVNRFRLSQKSATTAALSSVPELNLVGQSRVIAIRPQPGKSLGRRSLSSDPGLAAHPVIPAIENGAHETI